MQKPPQTKLKILLYSQSATFLNKPQNKKDQGQKPHGGHNDYPDKSVIDLVIHDQVIKFQITVGRGNGMNHELVLRDSGSTDFQRNIASIPCSKAKPIRHVIHNFLGCIQIKSYLVIAVDSEHGLVQERNICSAKDAGNRSMTYRSVEQVIVLNQAFKNRLQIGKQPSPQKEEQKSKIQISRFS